MVDKHIKMNESLDLKIQALQKKERTSYNKKVCSLLSKAVGSDDLETKINKIIDLLTDLKKINITILELEKQMYSDFNFTNITDIRNSYSLNEFFKKKNGDKYDK